MPLNRFGVSVNIGWADYEDLYIIALNTLTKDERHKAASEVAEMTGRTHSAIIERCRLFRAVERRTEAKLRYTATRQPRNDNQTVETSQAVRKLTEFEKMTGRRARSEADAVLLAAE